MNTLYIGKHFSEDPAGRYYTDGDGSGEEFREEILKPLFSLNKPISINIDEDVEGYGSSFLVEAFGGLIKHGYFTKKDVKDKLHIKLTNPDFEFYKKKIFQYIDEAVFNSMEYNSSKDAAIQNGKFLNLIDKTFLKDFVKP